MEEEKIKNGIKEIQNIKMTALEKENVLKNILNNSVPATKTKPIKSPYSFVSLFQNPMLYYAVLFIIVAGIGGGNIYLKNQKNKNPNNLAFIPNYNNSTNPENKNQEISINNMQPPENPPSEGNTPKSTGKIIGYLDNKNKTRISNPPSISSPQATYTPPITISGNQNNTPLSIMAPIKGSNIELGQEFTLEKDQIVNISNTGLKIKIKEFSYNPCSTECIWSGIGINFEYNLDEKIENGMNLVQAFGYQINIIDTDYKTYANLIVIKMQ